MVKNAPLKTYATITGHFSRKSETRCSNTRLPVSEITFLGAFLPIKSILREKKIVGPFIVSDPKRCDQ
jgi:hypothetical protein